VEGAAVPDLDEFEDGLIERFGRHPVLCGVERLAEADFQEVLLQRRFLSLAFTTAYDLAIDLLTDEQGVRLARVILREEYPDPTGHAPSHREALREDLFALGVSRAALVASRPAEATAGVIAGTLELIAETGGGEHADVGLLTILRFWGEVLVSVEYTRLWRRMAARLRLTGSMFYHPHAVHDAKAQPLAAAPAASSTHSDQLGLRLWQLLGPGSQGARDCFVRTERAAVGLREAFYDQFTPRLREG
jgi:hypothetical protein